MRVIYIGAIVIFLCMSIVFSAWSLAGMLDTPQELLCDQSFDGLHNFALQDGAPGIEENYGYTKTPEYQALELEERGLI